MITESRLVKSGQTFFGGTADAARPLLLIYPRIYADRLFLRFTGFGGSATAFSAFKVSAQKGLF